MRTHLLREEGVGETHRYHCEVCQWSWRYPPRGTWNGVPQAECPGVPRYKFQERPANLLTQTELAAHGLKPAKEQPVVGCTWWFRGAKWVWLYDTNTAVAKRKATPKQRDAAARARVAKTRARTCKVCQRQERHRLDAGLCRKCEDRLAAAHWADSLLCDPLHWVALDLETTGTGPEDEVVQIGVYAANGTPLLVQLVCPTQPISVEATRIHGFTQQMVAESPCFSEVYGTLAALLVDKTVVAYNAAFDERLLAQSCARYDLPPLTVQNWSCAMLQYAAFVGDYHPYFGDYRWQKLPGASHQAGNDCLAVIELLRRMAREVGRMEAMPIQAMLPI